MISLRTITITASIFIALLLIAVGLEFCNQRKENRRLSLNNHSLMAERDSLNGIAYTRSMTIREMKQYEDTLIQRLQLENISLKRLNRVTEMKVSSSRKNVPARWKPDTLKLPGKIDTLYPGRFIKLNTGCMSTSVFSPEGSDTAYISASCDVSGLLAIYQGKRIRQRYLFGLPIWRTGPRATTAQFVSDCDSLQVIIRDIEIRHD